MSESDDLTSDMDPEWEIDLVISLSAATLIDTVFFTADAVHAGSDSCIDSELVVADIVAHDEASDNYCRYVEQRYTEEDDTTWQDWTVELRLQETLVAGHWRAQVPGSPSDWEWCSTEAEKAFSIAAVLVGRRVHRGIVVDEPAYPRRPARTHH